MCEFPSSLNYFILVVKPNNDVIIQSPGIQVTSAQYTGHRLTETNLGIRTVSPKLNLFGSYARIFTSSVREWKSLRRQMRTVASVVPIPKQIVHKQQSETFSNLEK